VIFHFFAHSLRKLIPRWDNGDLVAVRISDCDFLASAHNLLRRLYRIIREAAMSPTAT
jgi:hypothetical protein